MTRTIKVSDEEVRAARLELQALESAGLRPESLVRQLAKAVPMRTEEIEELEQSTRRPEWAIHPADLDRLAAPDRDLIRRAGAAFGILANSEAAYSQADWLNAVASAMVRDLRSGQHSPLLDDRRAMLQNFVNQFFHRASAVEVFPDDVEAGRTRKGA
jgi:hypothetical protein